MIRRARPGRLYLMASPTYTILADTDMRAFCGLARDLGVLKGVKHSPPEASLSTGATILFRSADDPDRLRGPNLSGVSLNEASLMHEDVYHVAIASLREGGEQGWLTAGFTPKGFGHWTYTVFGKERPDAAIFKAHTRDNPFNPSGFEATLARQYGPALQRQELGGDFVSLEGAEWPAECFEHGAFWFDDWPQGAQWACRTIGVDPSKGKDARDGDYSAVVKYGVTWQGQEYCEADLARRPVDEICHAAAQAVKEFTPDGLYLEPAAFQDLMAPMIEAAMRNVDAHCSIHLLPDMAPKQVRIRRLTECIMGRKISFRRTPGTELLVQQLRDFGPKQDAAHDDGPDALEMARRLAIRLLRKGK